MTTPGWYPLSEDDWKIAIIAWKIDDNPAAPAHKAKAVVARGAAYFVATGKRLGEAQAPATASVDAASKGGESGNLTALGKFNLNTVTNQSSDVVLVILEGEELKVAYRNYKGVFGIFPPPEEELTSEQLTAIKHMLDADLASAVGFSLWVSHGSRAMQQQKFHGSTLTSDGTIIPIEV